MSNTTTPAAGRNGDAVEARAWHLYQEYTAHPGCTPWDELSDAWKAVWRSRAREDIETKGPVWNERDQTELRDEALDDDEYCIDCGSEEELRTQPHRDVTLCQKCYDIDMAD